jgi:glycosyltransferase involved in cell wall biosynthesis
MKIIIVNYRYFISGGPERYLFNITALLEKNGHTVIPFSIKGNQNKPTNYDSYFLEPIGAGDEVYFGEYKKTFKTVIRTFARMFYSFEAKTKFKKLIKDVKPDLIYILHFQNKISPSIIDVAHSLKVPIIQRISDFGHICANNIFYLYDKKEICERCLHGSRLHAVKHKCVYDSYFYSLLKVMALSLQDIIQTRKKISSFIIPSKFTAGKFIEFGVPKEKIHHIPTYFNKQTIAEQEIKFDNYALYIGRVDQDKGLFTLVKAFENTDHKLVIIGSSSSNFDTQLKDYLVDKKHNITFLGKLDFSEIQNYLANCLFTVCPSEWYDNFPNTILESFAFKKMVIASRIGSLVELVNDNQTGLLFEIGNHADLRKKVDYVFNNNELAVTMGGNAYETLNQKYSETEHFNKLIAVFNSLVDGNIQ